MVFIIFNPTIAFIVKIILGLLFIISGIVKLPALKKFFLIVVQYGILKGLIARIFAYSFPFIEIIVGLFLLLDLNPILFSGLVLLMILVSTSGVIYALYKKKKMDDCGCYGIAIKIPIGPKKVLENSVWILLAVYLFIFYLLVL